MRRNATLELKIPTFDWKQIGGDMSADKYGGTIAEADGDHIELLKIQPVRDSIGEGEAKDVGHPFWTREAWFDLADLDPSGSGAKDVKSALQSIGVSVRDGELVTDQGDILGEGKPEIRALVIAEALFDYGRGDEGPAGWSQDIYPERMVEWSYGEPKTMGEYLAEEDGEFRREVLGERYAVKVEGKPDRMHEEEDDAIEAAEEIAKLRPGVVVTVEDTFDGECLWSSDDPQHDEDEEREPNRRRSNMRQVEMSRRPVERDRIQRALTYVHHWEARERGTERLTRTTAAADAIGIFGLNIDEEKSLRNALNISHGEQLTRSGLKANMRQTKMPFMRGKIDADLKKRYEFFKTFGGTGHVGHAAESSLLLARAEKIAEERGWEAKWEEEQEDWNSFLGDEMTLEDISEVLWCGLYDEQGEILASLGGITFGHDSAENRRYRRFVEAELASEAADEKDLL